MKEFLAKLGAFFKNKSVGYYIAAGAALLSFIVGIIFFATYKNPDLPSQMGNKAGGIAVETIGIFLLAGFVVEVVVLVIPQYRFVQIIAIAMFGLAFYKDVILIPDFIVGKINNVEYNGGNFPLNMFFFITIFIILIASIIPAFTGFYKKEEEATADMPLKGNTARIIKVACSSVVVVAAVLAGSLSASALKSKAPKNQDNSSGQQSSEKKEKPNPITQRIIDAAELVDYDFNPESVLVKQEPKYEMSKPADDAEDPGYYDPNLAGLSYSATRSGYNLVYFFEGVFSEGYQGQYNTYSATLYLWDDGLFTGKSNSDTFKGYWYNSSIDYGTDEETGEDIIDCLNMVSSGNFQSIITEPVKGFYQRQGYVYLNPGWGGRSVVVSGYKYYPDVAIFIDTDEKVNFKVGEVFNRGMDWAANKVIKNLSYTPIVNVDEVQWTYPTGMLDSNNQFVEAGEYEIKAKWNGFEDSVTITVTDGETEAE